MHHRLPPTARTATGWRREDAPGVTGNRTAPPLFLETNTDMPTHFLHAGYLLDGSGEPAQKNVLLTITDGLIVAVTPLAGPVPPPLSPMVDLSHATLAPLFVDCLVHLTRSGATGQAAGAQETGASWEATRALIERHLLFLFRHGVGMVRECGDHLGLVARFREEAGRAAEPPPVRIMGARSGRLFVDSALTDGRGDAAGGAMLRQVNPAVREENKVLIRADGSAGVGQALAAGCHGLAGGASMGRENLKRLAESGVAWLPTLYAMQVEAELATSTGARQLAERALARQLEQVALARELGVTLALGTASGSPGVLHGEAVVAEMRLLIKAGHSLPEALRCATSNGARMLGVEAGLLTVGQPADFLVARGTPAQLPRKFSYLEAVYLGGEPSPFYRKNPSRGPFLTRQELRGKAV